MKSHLALRVELQAKDELLLKNTQVKQQSSDNFYREKILSLEKQKKTFEDELKQKEITLIQNRNQIENLEMELKKNVGLVEGYRNILN